MSISVERVEQEEKAYYVDLDRGTVICAACAWPVDVKQTRKQSSVEGFSVVWGDILDSAPDGCGRCGKKQSALIVAGTVVIEHPRCRIY